MLTKEGCLARQKRLWDAVPADVEWLLIADPRHVLYLSNFLVQPLSFSGGERALLLLDRGGRSTLIGDNFTLRSASAAPFVDHEVVEKWYDHQHSVVNRDHALLAALGQVIPQLAGRPGLVEGEWLPAAVPVLLTASKAAFTIAAKDDPEASRDLGTILRKLRRNKLSDELDLLRMSAKAGEAGMRRLREILRPGISELEIYLEVQKAALLEAGRPGLVYGDFRALTAAQPKAGGLPSNKKMENGDLFCLDYSVVLHGYRADFTNTLACGTPSAGAKELFAICQAGMKGGEDAIKAGTKAADVHAAVMQPFAEAGKRDAFPHHAGHGIGLAHPEPPILVPQSTDVLEVGDVITLEPGAYVPGVAGMRIERNYIVTASGFECITQHQISLT
ncbi:MAG TPA: Xaa-Pro peptidase family protein [Caulifigura sp.]|jgi:Xaa-Pro aminopeptidase|nr:Xaa-Pro peptidase family protein [Caulifigura sp.]